MVNKRGQGLSTNTLILIILGVIVLVVLALGFTMGWDKIAPWIGGGSNVDTIKQQCGVACSTNSVYDYCSMKRDLNDGVDKLKDVTCYWLSEKKIVYGIEKCGNFCKDTVVLGETCNSETDSDKMRQFFQEDTKILVHSSCDLSAS